VRKIRLVVAYDGTAFHGWQSQPGQRTVQGELERHLGGLLGEEVRLTAAGRTDAGCHARGQVVSFSTQARLPATALAPAIRPHLPPDLQVVRSEESGPHFDARRSALARRYSYRLLDQPDVLLERMAWHPRGPIDAHGLSRAVRPLEGEHDCAAFASQGSSPTCTRCRIYRAGWRRWDGGLVLDIVADHFLYHMVRTVVGTSLALVARRDAGAAMAAVLASHDRRRAGPTAPPQGLCLEQVFYAPGVRP
jgi:tRNA pseudouridine38-40 synthase